MIDISSEYISRVCVIEECICDKILIWFLFAYFLFDLRNISLRNVQNGFQLLLKGYWGREGQRFNWIFCTFKCTFVSSVS